MMASSKLNFFQCLVCEKLVADFWKAQKHLGQHETEENSNKSNDVPRRRGMLPIRKVTFYECYIPVVKNQVDPAFLEQYDNRVEALEECESVSKVGNGYDDTMNVKTDESKFPSLRLRPIRGKAVAAQRRLLSALKDDTDEEDDDEDDASDYTSVKSESTNSDEDDFRPYDDSNQMKGPKSRRRRRRKGLIEEDRTENGKNQFKCEYCSDDFPGKPTLHRHIEKDHRDVAKLIYCPIPTCNQPSINNCVIMCHIKSHLEAERILQLFTEAGRSGPKLKKVRCKYCLSPHTSINLLRNHVKKAHTDCTLKCPCCEKMFGDSVVDMLRHIKLNHPLIVDPYDERMKRRIAKQELKNRYKCGQCEKTFAFVSNLNQHLLCHNKKGEEPSQECLERPYPCPVCQKRFKHKDNLRRHFTLHLENNPFVCDIDNCNRKFNSDYNLRRHKLLHFDGSVQAEAYRETCPICHLSLASRDKLIRHLRVVHKPEDVTNGGPVLTKKALRTVRLPRIRGPSIFTIISSSKTSIKPETPEKSDTAATEQNSSALVASPPVPEKLKIEALPEIHLVDKIVIGSDGNALHLKGENLSPQKIAVTETLSSQSQEPEPTPKPPMAVIDVALNKLLHKDPIYKKLYFSNPDSLNPIYSRTHAHGTGRTFSCEECYATFTRAWTLQLHLKTIHNKTILDQTMESPSDGPTLHPEADQNQHKVTLMCGRCAYVAKNATDLENHMKTAPEHQPPTALRHRCHVCGVGCSSLKRLQEHTIQIHNIARNHNCRFCKKVFATSAHAKTHEWRVHENSTGVKKKRCPICSNYLTAASFNAHVKRHETLRDEETLKCQLCGDTFACKASLRRHIDCIHLGKPLNKNQKRKKNVPTNVHDNTAGTGYPGRPVKRGPKRADPTPDWIESLLATLDGHQSDSKSVTTELDTNKPAKHGLLDQPVPVSEKSRDPASVDDTVLSILGF